MSASSVDDERLLRDILDASEALVLATQAPGGELHATPLFHAPAPGFSPPCLVFASKANSQHVLHLDGDGGLVAAGLYAPHDSIGSIRGAQLRCEAWPLARCANRARSELRSAYLKRYPMAAALLAKSLVEPPDKRQGLHVLAIRWAKLTDNARLGLGVHRELEFPSARESLGIDTG